MQVLQERHSTRSFADKPIPVEVLSSLLWAAQGVNRDDPDYRTAPSSRNSNEIEIYVVLPQGAYLYKPKTHRLKQVVQSDMRAATGTQEFAATAPLNLITACTDAGFIGENVYLFCASEGLGTVFRAMIDANYIQQCLKLPVLKKVLYAQSVGYPSKS